MFKIYKFLNQYTRKQKKNRVFMFATKYIYESVTTRSNNKNQCIHAQFPHKIIAVFKLLTANYLNSFKS